MPDGAPVAIACVRRHDMVSVAPAFAEEVATQCATPEDHGAIAHWMRAAWPMVVRMQPPGAHAAGRLAVGAPLPPSMGRRRIALHIDDAWVVRVAPPPRLADVDTSLAFGWRSAVRDLASRAEDAGIVLRVFGSVAWQALTGISWLTPESDLDILWAPADLRELDTGAALLASWAAASGVPLDGELVFGERAVSVREWREARAGARLLVKTLHGVALCTRAELIAALAPAGGRGCAR